MKARASMNTSFKAILGIAILAITVAALLVGVGLIIGHLPGAVPMGAGGLGGPGSEYGGYLILLLVNIGLGSVVAWMLFGKRE